MIHWRTPPHSPASRPRAADPDPPVADASGRTNPVPKPAVRLAIGDGGGTFAAACGLAAAPGPPCDRGGDGDSGRRAGDRTALAGSGVECANRPRGDRRHVGGHPGGGCPGERAAGRGARGRCNRRACGAHRRANRERQRERRPGSRNELVVAGSACPSRDRRDLRLPRRHGMGRIPRRCAR